MDSPVVKYAVPAIGNLLGAIMLLSPCKAVWNIRKTQQLGAINPLPYPLTSVNCLGWLIYGAVINDPLIPPANVLGVIAGVVFTLTVLPLCVRKMQDILLLIFAGATAYFATLSMISVFALDDSVRRRLWGISAIVWLMVYYLIPLSTMVKIVRTKDASSIYMPLAFAAALNGGLWTVYGLAISDVNVWGPNAFGVLMAIVQLVLRFVFRNTSAKPDPASTKTELAMNGLHGSPGSENGSHDSELIMAARDNSRSSLLTMEGTAPSNPLAAAAMTASERQLKVDGMSDAETWAHTPSQTPLRSEV